MSSEHPRPDSGGSQQDPADPRRPVRIRRATPAADQYSAQSPNTTGNPPGTPPQPNTHPAPHAQPQQGAQTQWGPQTQHAAPAWGQVPQGGLPNWQDAARPSAYTGPGAPFTAPGREQGPWPQASPQVASQPNPQAGRQPHPPAKPKRKGLLIGLIAGASVLVLAAAGGLAYVLLGRDDPGTVTAAPPSPQTSPAPGDDTRGGASDPVAEPAPADHPSNDAPAGGAGDDTEDANVDGGATTDAFSQLERSAKEGSAQAKDRLEGKWVAQISSKKNKLYAEGKTWEYADILAEYQELQRTYGNVLMMDSDDFSTFKLKGYYVVVIDEPYDSASGALDKCDALGLDKDHCFAKLISTTHGEKGATKMNG